MEEIEAWIEKHRKRVIKRETDRRYYQKNKERVKEKKRLWLATWRKNNKELNLKRQREHDKKYYQKNKEILIKKKAETNSIRYWKDPELARKKDREWRKAYILKYA